MSLTLTGDPRADSWEFGPTLANHLPMVMVALRRMGASSTRLRDYAEAYRAINGIGPPPPPVAPIGPGNWQAHLGERRREADYRAFFASELVRLGPARLQEHYLPTLLPGIAASALHALMRLAYANLTDDSEEIATALAYWSAAYLLLPQGSDSPDTDDLAVILLRLRELPHLLAIQPETDLLWHAMRAVAADPAFAAALDRLRTDRTSLPRFAAASLALFAGAPDFCALHAVTSMHWVRLLPPFAREPALRHLWRALAAVYPKMGMPPLPAPDTIAALRAEPSPGWPEIHRAAIASDDEHDHSLVFSAWQESLQYGDPLYRLMAARRVGLV